jgi:hypothetical protein
MYFESAVFTVSAPSYLARARNATRFFGCFCARLFNFQFRNTRKPRATPAHLCKGADFRLIIPSSAAILT